ncbi:MAG TPA: ABC transporter permease [Acidimicrobiales bacterium]|nr:ABC transporter permease [Acidimicrobiales bacterium]
MPERDLDVAEMPSLTPVSTMEPVDLVRADGGVPLTGKKARQGKLGVIGWLSISWLALVTLAAILAPILPIDDPNQVTASIARQPPGTDGHIFGGDGLGRDLFSRIIWGGRSSLLIGTLSVLLGLVLGGLLGLVAGYFRGRADGVLTGGFDVLLSFPQLILALTLVTVFASGEGVTATRRTVVLILALGVVSIPVLGRITRANTLTWTQREFVLAARALGAKQREIMFREVLPNVLPAMFSIALLGVAVVIVAEGGLSLLGVGTQLPRPSWGNIIAEGRSELRDSPHIVIIPTIIIFLTVFALNYLGDVVRARFDVRESAL